MAFVVREMGIIELLKYFNQKGFENSYNGKRVLRFKVETQVFLKSITN